MLFVRKRNPSFALPKKYVLRSWFYPGLWLSDNELESLRKMLKSITLVKIQNLPDYGVYLPSREPYKHRIISVVFDELDGTPVGFGAMVRLPLQVGAAVSMVIHLGLVITTKSRLGRELLFLIYFWPLVYVLTLRKFRPFWITSVSMEPSIIGAVADNFGGVFPHYLNKTRPSELQHRIAEDVFNDHGQEFGMGPSAALDKHNFVIRGSCCGPSDTLRVDFRHSARYIVPACNRFCEEVLNYSRGDELLQVGQVSCAASISTSMRWLNRKIGRKLCVMRNRFLF
jgi:hypothetical protein